MCVPVVFCVPPPPVEQGYVVAVQKTEYEVDYDIHYLCKKNFLLDGPQKVTCLANGEWSAPPPHCRGEACRLRDLDWVATKCIAGKEQYISF